MNRIREHLSAWLVVGLLALGMIAVWGADRGAETLACADVAAPAAGIDLPRGTPAWAPDATLVGLPQGEPGMTSYEIAEARSLSRHGTPMQPSFVAHSGASRTDSAVC